MAVDSCLLVFPSFPFLSYYPVSFSPSSPRCFIPLSLPPFLPPSLPPFLSTTKEKDGGKLTHRASLPGPRSCNKRAEAPEEGVHETWHATSEISRAALS